MSRARRLSEIAKANQPVFDSTNGTQWWLADPTPKSDPQPIPPSADPEPKPAKAHQAAVALHETQPENSAEQSSAPTSVLLPPSELQESPNHFPPPEGQTPSDPFASPELQTPAAPFAPPELRASSNHFPAPELGAPSNHFPLPELQTQFDPFPPREAQASSDRFPLPEMQTPSNGAIPAESEPVSRDLASRLSILRGRFLALGRKNRGAEPE
jgi:hypothetical protein